MGLCDQSLGIYLQAANMKVHWRPPFLAVTTAFFYIRIGWSLVVFLYILVETGVGISDQHFVHESETDCLMTGL